MRERLCARCSHSIYCDVVIGELSDRLYDELCRRGKSVVVVEYSEIDPSEAASTDEASGQLKYPWSNICMHYFRVDWLRTVARELHEAAMCALTDSKVFYKIKIKCFFGYFNPKNVIFR